MPDDSPLLEGFRMVAAAFQGSTEQKILTRFLAAAFNTTGCSGGVLLFPGSGQWGVVATAGKTTPALLDKATQEWVEGLLGMGDVVDIPQTMRQHMPASFNLGISANDSLVLVIIRNGANTLLACVLLTVPAPHLRLSAAQICCLQAYAADARSTLLDHELTASSGLAAIERLRLLESVVVNAKDSILITEAQPIAYPGPRIVYCNPAFLKSTGFSLDEVLGATPRILQCEETSREALDQIRTALSRCKPIEIELINARRDGSRFWVQMSIVPVANEKGWLTHWVSVQRDVTGRKEAEQAFRQLQIDREEKVALESRLFERERIEAELTHAAFHDELTQLKNRAYFMARLQAAFAVQDSGATRTASVLYLDLDRFKYINDGMGHAAGDTLLKVVAARLKSCLSRNALLARIGGDEFAIQLSGKDHQHRAVETAARIVQTLGNEIEIDGQSIFTSCSIGIAVLSAEHRHAEDLIRDADVAMYAAKKQGRGRWVVFDLSMREASIHTLLMQNALKQAIANKEFHLVYQPIFSVTTGEIEGVEALIRWDSPLLGNISPDVFISVAEDVGIIYPLGQWVMLDACSQVQSWSEAVPSMRIKLNVNVSGAELNRKNFATQISSILKTTGFNAHDLQIEITESVFLRDPETVAKTLLELRRLGIRIALDDFGTGYSSLGYIDRYPIDAIKIDRSFVSRMMIHQRSVAIVKSILSLGRALDLAIVAEGVETESQLDQLTTLGCPYVQGFLLSPPLLAEEAKALFQRRSSADPG
nr:MULTISPECIES: EAL domain-containing protein [unclassified Pseudomonas]